VFSAVTDETTDVSHTHKLTYSLTLLTTYHTRHSVARQCVTVL